MSPITKQAAVAFVEREGKILCVWNRRFQGWGLPGGKVEEGEDLIAAVQRELKEETGLHASHLVQFYKAESALSDGPRMVHVFRVIASGEPREMEENCPVQWMTREELITVSPFHEFYSKMFTVVRTLKNLTERYAFRKYHRVQVAELRPYIPGETPIESISVSEPDRQQGSPKLGDMIARNPKNHADQWLVAADYFADNFAPAFGGASPEISDFERGAAVAFGLVGMGEAIAETDHVRKRRKPPKKKLYWCTTSDGDEDWFIIATSAREARSCHAGLEGYEPGDVEAELVTVLPEKWQTHSLGWPRLSTSILSDSGGVRVAYQPASSEEMRERMGVVSEAWRFGDRTFVPGDIVANVTDNIKSEN